MTQHLITTTMRPDTVVEVSDTELLDMQRMGLVASYVPSDLSEVPAPIPMVGKNKSGGSDGGQEVPQADGGKAASAVVK